MNVRVRCIALTFNMLVSLVLFLFMFYSGDRSRITDGAAERILEKIAMEDQAIS